MADNKLNIETDVAAIIKQQYTGILASSEAHKVEWRRVPIHKDLIPAIYTLLNDERVQYHKLEEFLTHGIHMLLEAYFEAGYYDPDLKAQLSYQKMIRARANHEKMKMQLTENMHSFDNMLDQAVVAGWEQADRIIEHLEFLGDLLHNEPTESGKQDLRATMGRSQSLFRALEALNRWCEVEGRFDEETVEQARKWQDGLAPWFSF